MLNQRGQLAHCAAWLAADDLVLLCGDAVYDMGAAVPLRLFALQEDAQARGLTVTPAVTLLDYPQMVQLCTEVKQVQTW